VPSIINDQKSKFTTTPGSIVSVALGATITSSTKDVRAVFPYYPAMIDVGGSKEMLDVISEI